MRINFKPLFTANNSAFAAEIGNVPPQPHAIQPDEFSRASKCVSVQTDPIAVPQVSEPTLLQSSETHKDTKLISAEPVAVASNLDLRKLKDYKLAFRIILTLVKDKLGDQDSTNAMTHYFRCFNLIKAHSLNARMCSIAYKLFAIKQQIFEHRDERRQEIANLKAKIDRSDPNWEGWGFHTKLQRLVSRLEAVSNKRRTSTALEKFRKT